MISVCRPHVGVKESGPCAVDDAQFPVIDAVIPHRCVIVREVIKQGRDVFLYDVRDDPEHVVWFKISHRPNEYLFWSDITEIDLRDASNSVRTWMPYLRKMISEK